MNAAWTPLVKRGSRMISQYVQVHRAFSSRTIRAKQPETGPKGFQKGLFV